VDTKEHDLLEGEEPSVFQVLRKLKRRDSRDIRQVSDEHGNTLSTFHDIATNFVTHVSHKFEPIVVDESAISTLQKFLLPLCHTVYAAQLQQTIFKDE
jgi:hypothetical protein